MNTYYLELARRSVIKALENLTTAQHQLNRAKVNPGRIKQIGHTIAALQNRNKELGSILGNNYD